MPAIYDRSGALLQCVPVNGWHCATQRAELLGCAVRLVDDDGAWLVFPDGDRQRLEEETLPRFRVLRSENIDDEADVSWFVEDWQDPNDPLPVDPYYDTEAEAVDACAVLNAGGAA